MKKLIAVTIGSALMLNSAFAFSDLTESHWAYKNVMDMQSRGVISGFNDNTFKPDNSLTREQFITMAVKGLKITKPGTENVFEDISDRWSEDFIKTAGYTMVDVGESNFRPGESALREDVAMAIVKMNNLENESYSKKTLEKFSDNKNISENRKKYVAIAVEKGLMSGNANGTFNPQRSLTRAEGATVIFNMLNKQTNKQETIEPINKNLITNDFELNSYNSINGVLQYGSYIIKDNEYKLLSIKATDYNLPSNLYNYKDDIRLRITYLPDTYEVKGCEVINYQTGEIIEDLSEESINKLFNIEYGKNINVKEWVEILKLSELKENEIYKYTATSAVQFPEIENDTGKNCLIYIKEWHEDSYEQEINLYDSISSASASISFNQYDLGQSFSIMYKEISKDKLLNKLEKDKIIYLADYNNGEKLDYSFEKYIYNNTDKNITAHIVDSAFGTELINQSVVIEKGQIYEFDWMIDSITISY